MLLLDGLILLFLIYSFALLIIGYLLAPTYKDQAREQSQTMHYFPHGYDGTSGIPVKVGPQGKVEMKPGGIFQDVPSGPVQRPSADQLRKWKEEDLKRLEHEAMNETFSSDTDLRMAKQFVTSRKQS